MKSDMYTTEPQFSRETCVIIKKCTCNAPYTNVIKVIYLYILIDSQTYEERLIGFHAYVVNKC